MGRYVSRLLGTLGTSFGIGPKATRATLDASGLSTARTITLPDGAGTVTLTIASGTAVLGTSAIASGGSSLAVTVAASGVLATDAIDWGFNSNPTSVTGYTPSTSGMLTIIAFPTFGNVNFVVCNNTSASITPGAVTLNWRVLR